MSVIKTAGIYLAKIFISIHTVGANNKCKLHKTVDNYNAQAICEAVNEPKTRFVSIKSEA
jgi:hypothetical protein